MSEAPLMVGVSGLRGIVGQSLTPEVAARFAGAFGEFLRTRGVSGSATEWGGRPLVIVGSDGRSGFEPIRDGAIAGLRGAGCTVVDVGIAMTPTIAVAADEEDADGAIVVTASHNPQQWNGLKCLIRERVDRGIVSACAPDAATAAGVVERFGAMREARALAKGSGGSPSLKDAAGVHLGRVVNGIGEELGARAIRRAKFRVVLDSVNGAGRDGGRELLADSLGCDLVHIGDEESGIFPHPPEPLRENLGGLCDAVRQNRAAVGFAQDPDADRLAIVDERGEYIGEEYTLALAAEAFLYSDGDPNVPGRPRPVLVTNLSTSRMIDDVAARHSAKVVRTAVGEANVVEAMKREWAAGAFVALGGEGNGGVIWPGVTYVRDSLSAMALVLLLMTKTGKTVSELVAGMPRYAIEKRKVDLARKEDAVPSVEKIAAHWKGHRVDRQDGVRVDFADGALAGKAWIHVRASNTEPIMRLIAEAPEVGQARAILDEAARVIA